MTKNSKPDYLAKAKLLSKEETERLLSRMGGKLDRRMEKNKLSREEALVIQLQLEDEQLQEWRKVMHSLKDKEATKEAKEAKKKAKAPKAKTPKAKTPAKFPAKTKTAKAKTAKAKSAKAKTAKAKTAKAKTAKAKTSAKTKAASGK